jgi:hypothetical protein
LRRDSASPKKAQTGAFFPMIRLCLAAATALLLAACSNAPEDVTASYSLAAGGGTMVIKAAANGDARVDSGGQTLIRRGGTEYLVGNDGNGQFATKVPDFVAVMTDVLRKNGVQPVSPGQQPEYELVKGGSETIADIKGDVWKVQPKNAPSAPGADAVISADPALANVGKAFAMHTRLGMASIAHMQGGAGSVEKRLNEMLDKGMVLRFGPALRLSKVERGQIDPASFTLPKTVLDRAALKKRLDAARDRLRAGPAAPASPAAPAPNAR